MTDITGQEDRAMVRPLYFTHTGALGGAELSLLDLVACRPGAGVAVLADGPLVSRLEAAGRRVHRLAGGGVDRVRRGGGALAGAGAAGSVWRAAGRLKRLAAEQRADVVYANSLKGMLVAALTHERGGPPVIWHLRDLLTPEHFSAMNRRVCVAASNRGVARVIANSHATASAYAAAGGRAPTAVVYNGIDAEGFAAAPPAADAPEAGRKVVGLFGRLSPWKGQHVLIDALSDLPDVEVWLVGEALFGEQDYATRLRDRAASAGVDDRVRFLGFRDDIAGLMKRCDVVAHTSTSPEPFGRVIVEGMLAGRPVVATDAGGAAELIDDGVTGRLTPPGDAPALAAALRQVLNTGQGERLAVAGGRFAEQSLTLNRVLPRWEAVLDGVVGGCEETPGEMERTS